MRWCVAQIKPKEETRAIENLQNQGFNIYLPLVRERTKKEVVLKSMFPGYVFVEIEPGDPNWKRINSTRGVFRVMMGACSEYPSLVPYGFVEALIQEGIPDKFDDICFFKKGDKVEFVEGPFSGHQGTCKWTSSDRVHLLFSILGRETVVYCNPDSLKLIKRRT